MERPNKLTTAAGQLIYAYRNLFDDVRLVTPSTVTLTPQEARQLAALLLAAAGAPPDA